MRAFSLWRTKYSSKLISNILQALRVNNQLELHTSDKVLKTDFTQAGVLFLVCKATASQK